MQPDPVTTRLSSIGRAAAWVVVALLAAAAVYAAAIAIINWGPIGV